MNCHLKEDIVTIKGESYRQKKTGETNGSALGVSWEQNYSCSQWSEATSNQPGSDHGDNHVPFTDVSGIGLKIHWWLLPVGGWEKQQPAGRKRGVFQICSWPHPLNKVYFWRIFSVYLNITSKQHSFKGDNQRNYMPQGGWFLDGSINMLLLDILGKNIIHSQGPNHIKVLSQKQCTYDPQ